MAVICRGLQDQRTCLRSPEKGDELALGEDTGIHSNVMGTLQLRVMAEFQAMERVWIYTSRDCMNANTLIINFATLDTVLRIGLTLEI